MQLGGHPRHCFHRTISNILGMPTPPRSAATHMAQVTGGARRLSRSASWSRSRRRRRRGLVRPEPDGGTAATRYCVRRDCLAAWPRLRWRTGGGQPAHPVWFIFYTRRHRPAREGERGADEPAGGGGGGSRSSKRAHSNQRQSYSMTLVARWVKCFFFRWVKKLIFGMN